MCVWSDITAVQDYEMHYMNAWLKRCVFNLDLNRESVSEPRTLSGRLFQSLGAKWMNHVTLNNNAENLALFTGINYTLTYIQIENRYFHKKKISQIPFSQIKPLQPLWFSQTLYIFNTLVSHLAQVSTSHVCCRNCNLVITWDCCALNMFVIGY